MASKMYSGEFSKRFPVLDIYLITAFYDDDGADDEGSMCVLRDWAIADLIKLKEEIEYCQAHLSEVLDAVISVANRSFLCNEHLEYWFSERLREVAIVMAEKTKNLPLRKMA